MKNILKNNRYHTLIYIFKDKDRQHLLNTFLKIKIDNIDGG
jgi:hypothetical protein